MELKKAIEYYCKYQERCHSEVRSKLYELGAKTPEVEEQIAELIAAGILNEERFARAFARGRFRLKQWGRVKITVELKAKKISEYCIRKGLEEIDNNDYFDTIRKLMLRKWTALKPERSPNQKKAKLFRYLQQKGFEYNIIREIFMDNLQSEER